MFYFTCDRSFTDVDLWQSSWSDSREPIRSWQWKNLDSGLWRAGVVIGWMPTRCEGRCTSLWTQWRRLHSLYLRLNHYNDRNQGRYHRYGGHYGFLDPETGLQAPPTLFLFLFLGLLSDFRFPKALSFLNRSLWNSTHINDNILSNNNGVCEGQSSPQPPAGGSEATRRQQLHRQRRQEQQQPPAAGDQKLLTAIPGSRQLRVVVVSRTAVATNGFNRSTYFLHHVQTPAVFDVYFGTLIIDCWLSD